MLLRVYGGVRDAPAVRPRCRGHAAGFDFPRRGRARLVRRATLRASGRTGRVPAPRRRPRGARASLGATRAPPGRRPLGAGDGRLPSSVVTRTARAVTPGPDAVGRPARITPGGASRATPPAGQASPNLRPGGLVRPPRSRTDPARRHVPPPRAGPCPALAGADSVVPPPPDGCGLAARSAARRPDTVRAPSPGRTASCPRRPDSARPRPRASPPARRTSMPPARPAPTAYVHAPCPGRAAPCSAGRIRGLPPRPVQSAAPARPTPALAASPRCTPAPPPP